MSLDIHGWDMHDIQSAMRGKSIFEVLQMYRDKTAEMTARSLDYTQARDDDNEAAIARLTSEYDHLEKEKCVIALHIANTLSKDSETR
ncbi:hypothetical protein ABGV42_01415 [Paenibacillus pabuli]|uniref:hypothetical protein n=1 Tax=Paenibacillus pabuli TaxID=1472 RepID=UPI003241EC8E